MIPGYPFLGTRRGLSCARMESIFRQAGGLVLLEGMAFLVETRGYLEAGDGVPGVSEMVS
jgi:hypothetical protein